MVANSRQPLTLYCNETFILLLFETLKSTVGQSLRVGCRKTNKTNEQKHAENKNASMCHIQKRMIGMQGPVVPTVPPC